MILQELSLTNFKNIADANLSFSHNINGLLGANGMGKSNLLDAIYYLSFGKSFTGALDKEIMRRGETFAMAKAIYNRRGQLEELTLGLAEGRPKQFKRQGKAYRRLSQHIGLFPVVLVSPADANLVNGEPEVRRRFLDMIIAQTDSVYLDNLIRYTEAVKQRNRLIKDGATNPDLFAAIEISMVMPADYITRRRAEFVARFAEIFERRYAEIALTDERPALIYSSKIAETGQSLDTLLNSYRQRDLAIGYTTVGPQRDNLDLQINGMPVKTAASQGQQKTFTIAMRLAQYEFLHEAVGLKPILLLDDIFDKLDSNRVAHIINVVNHDLFGQIFITDTNRDHLDSIMQASGADYKLWRVDNGQFSPLSDSSK